MHQLDSASRPSPELSHSRLQRGSTRDPSRAQPTRTRGEPMTPEERREFVLDHRTAIFGYNRAEHGPAMSIVYYAADSEEIVVSTMAERAKAKAVARNPRV